MLLYLARAVQETVIAAHSLIDNSCRERAATYSASVSAVCLSVCLFACVSVYLCI